MTRDSKRVDADEDRISDLPKNIIDDILSLLPVRDAARTSILSKNWRYIWAMLPNLVLDEQFCKKLAVKSQSAFKETVDMILLQHIGDIVKFDLDVSGVQLSSHTDIDRWMLYVTRNGVKDLTLNMSNNTSGAYKMPSYIINCLTLTRLGLLNCIFKPPKSFLGFNNLITLSLERITFVPTTEFCVINVPLLMYLTLRYCGGTQYLNIVVSSVLKSLRVHENHYNLDLNCFTNCNKLIHLDLAVASAISADKRSTYEKLLCSLPTLLVLTLSVYVLELLSAGTDPKGLPFTLNCLWRLRLVVRFGNMDQITYCLELIKSSRNLSKLEIMVYSPNNIGETVLDAPACLDQPLDKLKDVAVHQFKGSKAEMLFVKLLFSCTPSLVRMRIKPERAFDSEEEGNMLIELMRFPRASPKAELFYTPF